MALVQIAIAHQPRRTSDDRNPRTAARRKPPDRPLKWWMYVIVVLSLGLVGSRVGQRELAQALRDKARRRANGEGGRPHVVAADARGITVNPARLEVWALWGFVFGGLYGMLTGSHGAPVDSLGAAIAEAVSTGVGGSVLALFLAGLWNWAGRTR